MRLIISLLILAGLVSCGNTDNGNKETLNDVDSTTIADTTDYSAEYEATTNMKVGTVVPDFTLTTLRGEKFQLSELKGKTVFLNFFALTCPICIKELPELEKQIWQKYKDNKNLVVLTIGREETDEKLVAFRDKKGFTFPIATDADRSIYAMFAEKYIPRNIIIDKEGKLVFTEVGFNEEKFANLINEIEKNITE